MSEINLTNEMSKAATRAYRKIRKAGGGRAELKRWADVNLSSTTPEHRDAICWKVIHRVNEYEKKAGK